MVDIVIWFDVFYIRRDRRYCFVDRKCVFALGGIKDGRIIE